MGEAVDARRLRHVVVVATIRASPRPGLAVAAIRPPCRRRSVPVRAVTLALPDGVGVLPVAEDVGSTAALVAAGPSRGEAVPAIPVPPATSLATSVLGTWPTELSLPEGGDTTASETVAAWLHEDVVGARPSTPGLLLVA